MPRTRSGATRGLAQRLTRRCAARAPDVGRRLLDDVPGFPPDLDRVVGGGQHRAVAVEEPGAGAAGADVDAEIEAVGHV